MVSTGAAVSEVISLPKGGGAVQGVGETFAPDLFTGTGNFTVPIALPPGRNGFQPELNLVYSTGHGNGPFGMGWALSIPGVSRKTSKSVPRYEDAEDVFILSGAEDLVPVAGDFPGPVQYRPRTEGLFALITFIQSQNSWEVKTKDGLVSHYGDMTDDPLDAPAVIADPDSAGQRVFAWKLVRTRDTFGNRILYDYEHDRGEGGGRRWDQLYLKRIRYVEYDDAVGVERFLVSVTFEYEDRPDPFSEYRPGFEVRTRRRCSRIVIRTHGHQEHLVRTYELDYLDERMTRGELSEGVLPPNGVSLLSQIRVVGHDESQPREADRTQALPPVEFGYTPFRPQGRKFFPLECRHLPAPSLGSPDLELVDLFGNGLPDILEMNGTVRYWRNLGGGRFDLPRPMAEAPAGLRLADPGVQLLDAQGDGRADLLATSNGLAGYFPLSFEGTWDRRSFQRYRHAPSFSLDDPEVALVDLDGDGVTDAVRSGSRIECFFNDSHEGWQRTRHVERRHLEVFPNVNFSDPRVRWADMTGDGLQDVVLLYDGNVEYWPNLGHGNWGPRIHMRNSPRFPHGYDPGRVLLGDVDGDGLADLVYVDHCKVVLYINQSGNRWSDPIEIHGTPAVTDLDTVQLVDALGTGVAGVLWSAQANGLGRAHLRFLDLTGGLKPYLMTEMDNHMGAVTRVEYAPSTRFYLDDAMDRHARWKTTLPFPVQVVARVEVIDELSGGKLTTEYRYHHGYWDGAEREFRGFGRVDQRDTEIFDTYHAAGLHPDRPFEAVEPRSFSPPTETRTWFHLGPVGEEFGDWREIDYSDEFCPEDPQRLDRPSQLAGFLANARIPRRVKRDAVRVLRGAVLRTELYALDGSARQDRPVSVTEQRHGVREEAAPADPGEQSQPRIFFPHVTAERATHWERGDDPLTRFTLADDYDPFGQPRQVTEIACPRGWRRLGDTPAQPYLGTRSRTVYATPVDDADYVIDRVATTTTYELQHTAGRRVLDLPALSETDPALAVIGQTLNFYDDGDLGKVGDHGAVVRSESLVLTEEILHEAYRSGQTLLEPPETPSYLVPGTTTPSATQEYPQEFLHRLPPLAGYIFHAGDADRQRGYFVATMQNRYDFQVPGGKSRGLLRTSKDPFGRETTIGHDAFDLLPTRVTDPAGLVTTASYDGRVLQPREVTGPNGNRTRFAYTPLALVKSTAVMGKAGEAVGDTVDLPGTRLEYDLLAFDRSPAFAREPVSVRTIQRVHHAMDTDVPLPERNQTVETVEYSDGFGRLVQTRAQAEDVTFGDPRFGGGVLPADQDVPTNGIEGHRRAPDAPANVVVSGWQIYDNKGRVVETFQPFFDTGFAYLSDQRARKEHLGVFGQKATLFYDPLGRAVLTVNPDGSEQRVIFGVPGAIAAPELSQPDSFEPTPWETYTYDENDNAGRTHGHTTRADPTHLDTPASLEIDALGRTIASVERNGADPASEWFTTRSVYDIRGNLLTVTDALDRVAFRYLYDLADNPLRIDSIDGGGRRLMLDAAGNEIERRDAKGALILQAHDVLGRPVRLWARDDADSAVTLRERLAYGDGGDLAQDPAERTANRANNRLGELHEHYDEAGRLTFELYDFKGNVVEKVRQVISDDAILAVFVDPPPNWEVQPFRVDWQPPAGASLVAHAARLLDPLDYRFSTTHDGLSRIKSMLYPEDVEGRRRQLRPRYNRAGAIERITLDGEVFVEHIAYDTNGQRTLVALGNDVMIRFAYDPTTFRLTRLRSERCTKPRPDAPVYERKGPPLQDFGYDYNLVGNVTRIRDRTPGSGTPNTTLGTDALDRAFTYDPLYRLLSATGREHDIGPPAPPWIDRIKTQDVTKTRPYRESYAYDRVGNIRRLRHSAKEGGFIRRSTLASGNNRLETVTIGQTRFRYRYDRSGNLTRETSSRHFQWDHSDRMKAFRTQAGTSEPSVHAHYLCDAAGQRVKKLVRKQEASFESTIYIDELFEHLRWHGDSEHARDNNWLHVMDGEQRIALVRVGKPQRDDNGPPVQYHLGDHLGSANLVIDGDANSISREEYSPYAETTFGSFAMKRYRFTGREREAESGLQHHGQRYYAPWLARWVSCDPLGPVDGVALYQYARSDPLSFVDIEGTESYPVVEGASRVGGRSLVDRYNEAVHHAQMSRVLIEFYDVWTHGSDRGLLLDSERDAAEAIFRRRRGKESRKDEARMNVDAARRSRNIVPIGQIQLGTFQPFAVAAFGAPALGFYSGFQLTVTAHDVAQACRSSADECATVTFPAVVGSVVKVAGGKGPSGTKPKHFGFLRPKKEKFEQHTYGFGGRRGARLAKDAEKGNELTASLLSPKYSEPSSWQGVLKRANDEVRAGRAFKKGNAWRTIVDMEEHTGWVGQEVTTKLEVVFGKGGWHYFPTL